MFSDPITLTVNAIAKTLNGTSTTEDGKKYASSTRDRILSHVHTYRKRARHTARLQTDTIVANPLISGNNVSQSMSVYLTVDTPLGYDTVLAKQEVEAFLTLYTAGGGANITKLLGGES